VTPPQAPKPKFPAAIPNNLGDQASNNMEDDEKTDPNLVIPNQLESRTKLKLQPLPANPASPQTAAPRPAPRMPEMGPLDAFMKDPTITEIMVNDVRNVMIEREGKMTFSGFAYQSIDELNRLVRNILDITGRILTPDQPYVDTMMPDGSRVNIVGPPLTVNGPCLTIRKFPTRRMSIHDLMGQQTLDQKIAYFLNACVLGRINILVCGGTGSGKTTLLNALTSFIPKSERIITIEDTPELVVPHFNSVRLQTKPQSPASPPISARDLVANALRMRPDRIIIGECRKAEALDMLQAMNTGHTGSMTTIHANSPRDGLSRIETLCLMTGVEIPLLALRKQMASAIDLIIQIKRFRSGKRRIVNVSEVTGMEGETILLQEIFAFDPELASVGRTDDGQFKTTGLVPKLVEKLREQGIELPSNYFA